MDYKTKTDTLIAGLQGKTLSAEKRRSWTRPSNCMNWYDYLDAFRLATAAAS